MQVSEELKKYASELDDMNIKYRSGTFPASDEINDEIFSKLLGYNVLIPYSDAVEIKNKGILISGEGQVGKSTLALKFKNLGGKILSLDAPLLYNNDKLNVFDDDEHSKELGGSGKIDIYPFLSPLMYPEDIGKSLHAYNLTAIVHVEEGNNLEIKKKKMNNELLDYIIFDSWEHTKNNSLKKQAYDLFKDVNYINVKKPRFTIKDIDKKNRYIVTEIIKLI